jgi:hypothetical protein
MLHSATYGSTRLPDACQALTVDLTFVPLHTRVCPGPGDYSIEETAFWSERMYTHVFRLLNEYSVVSGRQGHRRPRAMQLSVGRACGTVAGSHLRDAVLPLQSCVWSLQSRPVHTMG